MKLKFTIQQLAFCPKDPIAAKKLLTEMGAGEWAEDRVVAAGAVFGLDGTNVADLSFNYDMFNGKELEVLNYTTGPNWMAEESRVNSVSHIGTHVSAEELLQWREFFAERNIAVAQEVITHSHTNPVIAGKRSYNYVIFDTKEILGVDVKFIVRKNLTEEAIVTPND